jgi:polyisoprenoid-binding protein YceI
MKRAALCLFLLVLLVLIATVAIADRYTTSKGSLVRIEGTSSLHEWSMEGTTLQGHVVAPPLEQWQNGTASTEVSVAIPVASIKSEHAKMDRLMADALKASANPTIRYAMTSALLAKPGIPFTLDTKGKLTIAGVTRDVAMQVTGTRDSAGTYVFTGTTPIRMSDYGIKPPTAMLGTIRTGNDVKVTFRWAVEPGR